MERLPLPARLYIGFSIALGTLLLGYFGPQTTFRRPWLFLLLLAMVVSSNPAASNNTSGAIRADCVGETGGVGLYDGRTYEELLSTADSRMYRDKTRRKQRGRVRRTAMAKSAGSVPLPFPEEISEIEIQRAGFGVL